MSYNRPDPLHDITVHEDLPYPYVLYPGKHGVFCAFAEHETSDAVLCSCARPSINTLVELRESFLRCENFDLSDAVFSSNREPAPQFSYSRFFPSVIIRCIETEKNPLAKLSFRSGCCHRCCLSVPSIEYCHKDYASGFVSRYGWYVSQKYLVFGIFPFWLGIGPARFMYFTYVDTERLQELQNLIADQQQIQKDYFEEHGRLVALIDGPWRNEVKDDERYFTPLGHAHTNLSTKEAANYAQHRSKLHQAANPICKYIENLVRIEFGHKKIGDHWINETILYQIVGRIFAGKEVWRHSHPEWLGGLELDVYLSQIRLAIEYQGQQHFHAIKAWGGESALRDVQERDRRKKRLCSENGVKLIHINYTDPLTEEYVRQVLKGF